MARQDRLVVAFVDTAPSARADAAAKAFNAMAERLGLRYRADTDSLGSSTVGTAAWTIGINEQDLTAHGFQSPAEHFEYWAISSATETDLIRLLTEHCATGMAAVVATHSPALAEAGSRVIRLQDGRVIDDTGGC